MNKFRLNIDGKEVTGIPGQTILDVALENDIYIPTLCFDERTEIYGACGICVCEVEGNPKLVKACATEISPNMVVFTKTDRVIESRKTNLELLLSNHVGDCRPPCVLSCPAGTDCQGYVGLIANGQFKEAYEIIREKIPLPASIGRVCPHPCETACRRKFIDEPVSIAALKRFAGDFGLDYDEPLIPEIPEATGKSIAIIGGGPGGLSAAFFLRQLGHEVTIFEQMPKFGGMMRYGIPEYRLPKAIIDEEVYRIEQMGVEMIPNMRIGKDISFDKIRADYDAVFLSIGAWKSAGLGCKGEDAEGVIGGIDFLRKVVKNEEVVLGEKVAIVGGGNTAMDAARTAVRLGCKEVYNIYRRTVDEMPAEKIEIKEAQEEGVIFKNLCNPIEVIKDKDGKVSKVVLQKMMLGEADASGRRSPVPIEGETETIELDNIIVAIGQAVDSDDFDLDKTRKKGILTDEATFMTSMEGVFAGGDCFNDKITIAVEAIGHAEKAALVIDAYLNGEKVKYRKPYGVEKEVTAEEYEDRERIFRSELEEVEPDIRKNNFSEIIETYDYETAIFEGARCLECGCHDYFECKLVDLANQYDVAPQRFDGDKNTMDYSDDHPFIVRDVNKCILCGLCVRICDEVVGAHALGLVHRGFDTVVKPAMEVPLMESGCVSCGQCVSVCPTGALQERITNIKDVPLQTECVDTTCSFCSVGCSFDLEYYGDSLIKANPCKHGPVNKGLACGKGKFGFDLAVTGEKLFEPMIKVLGELQDTDYHDALMTVAKRAQAVATRYGKDKVVVAVSDRYTNEEAYAIKKLADYIGAKTVCLNSRQSGLVKVLGIDASPNTIDEMLSTNLILTVGYSVANNPVIQLKMKQAAQNGAKIIEIIPETFHKMEFSAKAIIPKNDVAFLKEIAKALIESGKAPKNAEGFEAFKASLEGIKVSEEAKAVADEYAAAKKAMIVFSQNIVSVEAAELIANIAVISGHIGTPRDGILQVKAKNNSQGLIAIGITEGKEALKDAKALLIFGEDPDFDLSGMEFVMVSDTHLTKTAEAADVVLPGTGYASTDGTFINTERRILPVAKAIDEGVYYNNWELAVEIAHAYEIEMPYESVEDISNEMNSCIMDYKYAELMEVNGGALYSAGFGFEDRKARIQTVGNGILFDPQKSTDQLMNTILARLPKPTHRTCC